MVSFMNNKPLIYCFISLKSLWKTLYIYIYISVAKPYGRFGQKLESLQAGQERTGQERTGEDMAGQGRGTDQKRTEQKQCRAWAKNRTRHDGHFAI